MKLVVLVSLEKLTTKFAVLHIVVITYYNANLTE
jgi:hypothetical protein